MTTVDARSHELRNDGEDSHAPGLLSFTIFYYRRWVIAALLLGTAMGFLYGAIQTNTYLASGKLLIKTGARESSNAEIVAGNTVNPTGSAREAIETELRILENPEIYRRVLDVVGIDRFLEIPVPGRGDDESTPLPTRLLHKLQAWLYGSGDRDSGKAQLESGVSAGAVLFGLRRSLHAKALHPSSVIEVTFEGADPEMTRDVVNAYLESAEIHHRTVFSSKDKLEFSRSEEKAAWSAVSTATNALEEFNQEHGIYDLPAQRVSLASWISAEEQGIQLSRNEIKQLASRITFLKNAIAEVSQEPAKRASLSPNPEYVRLQANLSALTLRHLDLQPRVGELGAQFDRRKLALGEMIAAVEAQLAEVSPTAMEPNLGRAQRLATLQASLDQAEESHAGLNKVVTAREAQLRTIRKRLLDLNEHGPESESLAAAAVRSAKVAEGLSERREHFELMEMLDDQRLGNLKILERAVTPRNKSGPMRGKFLVFGGLSGAVLGFFLAFVRSATYQLLRRPSELAPLGGSPVLAVVPRAKRPALAVEIVRGDAPAKSQMPELIRGLRESFARSSRDSKPRRIAIVGCSSMVGCTTVAVASARGLIESGSSVLLVGSPQLANELKAAAGPELKRGRAAPAVAPRLHVFVVEDGSDMASLEQVQSEFDVVLLDVGDFDTNSALAAQLAWADSFAMVVAADQLAKIQVQKRLQMLGRMGNVFLGTVFNLYQSKWPFWYPGVDPELQVK